MVMTELCVGDALSCSFADAASSDAVKIVKRRTVPLTGRRIWGCPLTGRHREFARCLRPTPNRCIAANLAAFSEHVGPRTVALQCQGPLISKAIGVS